VGEGTLWAGRTLYDLYAEAYTPWEWLPELQAAAAQHGLDLFSSPFDHTAVDFLAKHDVPAYKIASFELVDHELIRYAASKGKPLILSTGMATAKEIDDAVRVAREGGAAGVALLRCNSAYPAPPEEMDLRTIPDMVDRWRAPVGLSDHTVGVTAAVAAVALGACILEKHFTLTRDEPGPDSAFSLEPKEFAALVLAVREAEAAAGSVRYGPSDREQPSLAFRRSLFAVQDVRAGDPFTEENVRAIRPGQGLAPKELPRVLGRRAAADIERGTPLTWELVED
jgi:N-acetylneuraminate synthase